MIFKFKLLFLIFFSISGFSMVIDNLDNIRGNWSAISDNVMGGISEVNFYEIEEDGKKFYRLEGQVSTENNGGFIQSVVRINNSAEDFNGIRVQARGSKDGYYLWIRTPACRFPWDRYIAYFEPSNEWSSIEIPFSGLKKSNFYMPKKMNSSRIKTIALAAYGKDFDARLDIGNIEFY